MNEEFHYNETTKAKVGKLLNRKNSPAIYRFIIMYSIFLASSVLVVIYWSSYWWEFSLFLILYGIVGASLFACEHETVHNTAFKSNQLNKAVSLLCGIGHWYAPTSFRELHFTHHRFTNIPGKDPEISIGDKPAPSIVKNHFLYIIWLTGIPLFLYKFNMLLCGALGCPEFIRKRFFPFIRPEVRLRVFFESILIFGIQLIIFYLAITYNPGFWALIIGQWVSHALLSNYLVMEHNGLAHTGGILEKTRSIKVNRLIKIIMWNMPYHAEHHAYPGVPFHALPQLHDTIKPELKHIENHLQFNNKVITGQFKKTKDS